ncbi:MAG: lysine--tRNA ligase [Candidatus Levybacteria bacterium]|nr:lysine--tRNA ligase [Candidatus Levybacteria bacterium]
MDDSELIKIRKEKIEKIRALGWNPYAASYPKTHTVADALKSEGKRVSTAGRLFSFREHGNIAFADLRDETGKIQLFFKKNTVGQEAFKNLKLLDIGDIIGVEGEVGTTEAGEISIIPSSYTLLTKAIRPLPNQWYGLKDVEARFRQRYLDLLLNPEVRARFNTRTKLISGVREYLDNLGFWEAETPVLQPLYGGANAKPFTTHLNALDQDMYLRIADELYLKRLIVGGYERVYEICKDFRNEGIDQTHFPEFTMIEWYEAYADYHRVMDVAEGLFKHLAKKIYRHTTIQIDEKKIDIGKKWPRIEMQLILKKKLGLDVDKETRESLLKYAKKHLPDMQILGGETKGQLIFNIFDHTIPKTLIAPTWIIDYPEDISPLAKTHRSKPGWVERFEGYIGGKEVADGWSELTDPVIQRARFTADTNAERKDKEEAQHVDEDFLMAMEHGMPPLGGIGIGIDRLTMFFTNRWAIKEVVLFPTLKVEKPAARADGGVASLKTPEIFSISRKVSETFSSLSVGVAIIKNVSITKSHPELEKEKEKVLGSMEGLTTDAINAFPEILSYRKLYKAMGIDWHSRRPSPEALLRRIALKKGLYTVNTCVDAYNLIVMKNRVSVGAFDLDKISFPTELRFAKPGEKILLLGDTQPTAYTEKELAYFDQTGGYNIDFNYRDAQRTAVWEDTKNLYINVDGVFDISPQKVEAVLREACDKIIKYCGGKVQEFGVVTAS